MEIPKIAFTMVTWKALKSAAKLFTNNDHPPFPQKCDISISKCKNEVQISMYMESRRKWINDQKIDLWSLSISGSKMTLGLLASAYSFQTKEI